MSILFPCLDTDISRWFPKCQDESLQTSLQDEQNQEELINTLKKFLINPYKENKKDEWLSSDMENVIAKDTNINEGNIMSPVLKDLPNSHWLLTDDSQKAENQSRAIAPSMATSIWLASTSNENLTCLTRTKSTVTFPDIFFSESSSVWLTNEKEKVSNIDIWLASSFGQDDNLSKMEARNRPILEKSWLVSTTNWVDVTEDLSDGAMDIGRDDESSIAVIDDHDCQDDFDFVDDDTDNMSAWLL